MGLKNQGATCYMSSLLQSLYHVPALQRAVYKMPTEQETSMKLQRCASQHPAVITRQENGSTQESVALALQRVFYHLRHSNKSVGTMQLIKSFDKTIFDAFTQHEVQELDRVLCDNLEQKMKGTPVEKEVSRLFCGQLKNFVKCINVNFSSERVEDFYDLSLKVRGCKNLKESLEKYVEREKLDGDNKYMADLHGLQDAERKGTFSSFPPVLHLHLKRFEYDPLRDAHVKINDRFEFDEAIDLAPYMEALPGRSEIYQLHSVLVHCMPQEEDSKKKSERKVELKRNRERGEEELKKERERMKEELKKTRGRETPTTIKQDVPMMASRMAPPSDEAERERKREAIRARIEATKTAKGEEVLELAGGEHLHVQGAAKSSSAEGDVHGGHYHAYIRPDCKERWFNFNDEIVTEASREEAVESNYGFGEDSDRTRPQAPMMQRSRPAPRRSSNACMLVYVKEQAVGDVLRPLVSLKRALREP